MKIWSSCLSLLVALVTSPLLLTATGVRAAPAGPVESIASILFSTGGFDISWSVGSGSLGVVDALTGQVLQMLPSAPGARTVAAYEGNGHIFLPTTLGEILIFGNRVVPVPAVSSVSGTANASVTVTFSSTTPGQGEVYFGSGPGCQDLVEVATRDLNPGSTQHPVVVTGNDLPGTVGDIGITPGATYWYETVTLTSSGPEIDNNGGKCYRVTIPAA